jgi:hypothetical protein
MIAGYARSGSGQSKTEFGSGKRQGLSLYLSRLGVRNLFSLLVGGGGQSRGGGNTTGTTEVMCIGRE